MLVAVELDVRHHRARSAKIPVTTKSPEALAHYQKGVTFLEKRARARASKKMKQALALDPQFLSAKALLRPARRDLRD